MIIIFIKIIYIEIIFTIKIKFISINEIWRINQIILNRLKYYFPMIYI